MTGLFAFLQQNSVTTTKTSDGKKQNKNKNGGKLFGRKLGNILNNILRTYETVFPIASMCEIRSPDYSLNRSILNECDIFVFVLGSFSLSRWVFGLLSLFFTQKLTYRLIFYCTGCPLYSNNAGNQHSWKLPGWSALILRAHFARALL